MRQPRIYDSFFINAKVNSKFFCRCIKITMPSKILDEYSELARNKAIKTQASRVIAINEFYSTGLPRFFFQDKISIESSKMSTLVGTFLESKEYSGSVCFMCDWSQTIFKQPSKKYQFAISCDIFMFLHYI